jgi:hypothetical protein
MAPYTEEAFARALQQGKVTTFYVVENLEEVVEYVNREKLSFRRYFSKSATVPSSMNVYMNNQADAIELFNLVNIEGLTVTELKALGFGW